MTTRGQPGQPAPPYQRGDVGGYVPRSGSDANIAANAQQRWNAAQRGAYGRQLQRLFIIIITYGGGGAGEATAAEAGSTGMGRGGGGTEGEGCEKLDASPTHVE